MTLANQCAPANRRPDGQSDGAGNLAAAARTVITVYRAASGRPDAVPGRVGAIQIPLCGINWFIGTRISTHW